MFTIKENIYYYNKLLLRYHYIDIKGIFLIQYRYLVYNIF